MSGNDRRTALLGRLEQIRELIASFFRAFTQDEVHLACLRRQPYSTVQPPSITSGRQHLRTFTEFHADRTFPAASLRGRASHGLPFAAKDRSIERPSVFRRNP